MSDPMNERAADEIIAAILTSGDELDHALHYDPTCEECVYLARSVAVAVPGDDLGAAWAEALAVLPDDWGLALHKLALDDWAEAVAGPMSESASSPAVALREITVRLREHAESAR